MLNRPLRILFIADQYSFGGAADALLESIVCMKEKYGVEAIVATAYNNALSKQLDERGIAYICAGHRQFAYNLPLSSNKRNILFRVLRAIRYWLADIKALTMIESRLDMTQFDLVYSNVNRNDIGGILARRHNIPHVWHLREKTEGHFELAFNRLHPFSYMNKIADYFIAISQTVMADWVNRGVDATKIHVIYDGADIQKIKKRTCQFLPDDFTLRIICVGQVTPEKGQEILIRALGKLKCDNFDLDIYGNCADEYLSYLKGLAKEGAIEKHVHFKGFSNMIPEILHNYDVGVNPSKGEGFGRVTVEYMAAALFTLAQQEGVGLELIHHGEDGYLFENENDLSICLENICKAKKNAYLIRGDAEREMHEVNNMSELSDWHHIQSIAEMGRKKAFANFDIKKNIEQIYKACEGLCYTCKEKQ